MDTGYGEIGYGYLVDKFELNVSGYRLHAKVDTGVLAVRQHGNSVQVPTGVDPSSDDPLDHLEFALSLLCMEFGVQMTHYALDTSLIKESDYLKRYDTVYARINSWFDIVDKDLHALIRMAYSHEGRLSLTRRKQYLHRVQPAVLDAIEAEVQEVFFLMMALILVVKLLIGQEDERLDCLQRSPVTKIYVYFQS